VEEQHKIQGYVKVLESLISYYIPSDDSGLYLAVRYF
jgi:hypothetical protein